MMATSRRSRRCTSAEEGKDGDEPKIVEVGDEKEKEGRRRIIIPRR